MTTKEKVIRESIKRITKQVEVLEKIQNAAPAVDLMNVRKEAQQLLEDNKGIEKRTCKSFMAKIEVLSEREKACRKMIDRQKNWEKDCNKLVNLQIELGDLNRELYYIERLKN